MKLYSTLLIQWILMATGAFMISSVPVSLAQDDYRDHIQEPKQRTHPNQEGTRTTGQFQTKDHQRSKHDDIVSSSTVRTHNKNADSRNEHPRQNDHIDSDQELRYENHHGSSDTVQPDQKGGKNGHETTKYTSLRTIQSSENRSVPTDRDSYTPERNSNLDYHHTTAKQGSDNHSNPPQHHHPQDDGQHSQSQYYNGRDSSTPLTKTDKLHVAKEDGNDLTYFSQTSRNSNPKQENGRHNDHLRTSTTEAANKRESLSHHHGKDTGDDSNHVVSIDRSSSNSAGGQHDPTGDGNVDWNSKVDQTQYTQDGSSSNTATSVDDSSTNKMPVVYCSVIVFLLVAAFQLKPH
ncbi:unnamed protein product [Cylindrotheca closterium]|uniref:Uncharacterized protein n=1 Tax=Cylindrotheca closterium TaxID=2856 RepID=A0AAD2CG06_9STRA|nr:unnamed protein product [Cylindrotheca closterium]